MRPHDDAAAASGSVFRKSRRDGRYWSDTERLHLMTGPGYDVERERQRLQIAQALGARHIIREALSTSSPAALQPQGNHRQPQGRVGSASRALSRNVSVRVTPGSLGRSCSAINPTAVVGTYGRKSCANAAALP